ncbi:unnamed protein product [Allacma fusca]|uniref:Uncharacterized protein n=1 Tax=Allacma fusca TaxID=39272 RepID=A0A8J2LC45_9HEXA|nr:unnamed protein product [Allacma fusca]
MTTPYNSTSTTSTSTTSTSTTTTKFPGGFFLLCGEDHTTAACDPAPKAKIEVKPPPSRARLTIPDEFRLQTHKPESRVRIVASPKIARGTKLGTLNDIRRFHHAKDCGYLLQSFSRYMTNHLLIGCGYSSTAPLVGAQIFIFTKVYNRLWNLEAPKESVATLLTFIRVARANAVGGVFQHYRGDEQQWYNIGVYASKYLAAASVMALYYLQKILGLPYMTVNKLVRYLRSS